MRVVLSLLGAVALVLTLMPGVAGATPIQAQTLLDASAVSPTDVWAVGESYGPSGSSSLILHYDGSTWSVANSPSPSGFDVLNAVSAVSSTDAWAVGQSGDPGLPEPGRQALIEHWDGSAWSVVPSPTTAQDEILVDVAAVSSTDAWAVGYTYSGYTPSIVLRWDGASWDSVPIQSLGLLMRPKTVAAVSDSDVWVLGDFIDPDQDFNEVAFAQHWDGSTWSVVPVQDPSTTGFRNSAAVSANDVWVVGWAGNGRDPLTEHWDGSTWSIVPSPGRKGHPDIGGVAASSSSDVWAVGQPTDGSLDGTVEHWNGSAWKLVNPEVPAEGGFFYGAAAETSGDSWIVGQSGSGWGSRTLVEHWKGSSWRILPTPNPIQDSSLFSSYDGWGPRFSESALAEGYRSSDTAGSRASAAFTGPSVTWVTRTGPDQGIALVSIDGQRVASIDLYSSSAKGHVKETFNDLGDGDHRIVIRVTGRKDHRSTGDSVAVDAIGTLTTWMQETSSSISYNGWNGVRSPSANGGSIREVASRGAAQARFTGRTLKWITQRCPDCGRAKILIDGRNKGVIDLYSPTMKWGVTLTFRRLGKGIHTVRVVATGTRNPDSAGTKVVLDAFVGI